MNWKIHLVLSLSCYEIGNFFLVQRYILMTKVKIDTYFCWELWWIPKESRLFPCDRRQQQLSHNKIWAIYFLFKKDKNLRCIYQTIEQDLDNKFKIIWEMVDTLNKEMIHLYYLNYSKYLMIRCLLFYFWWQKLKLKKDPLVGCKC